MIEVVVDNPSVVHTSIEYEFQVKPVSNWCKYHKPDTVGRPGRLVRGELK